MTVSPTTGQLEYYGADGYLCKTYPPNFTAPYSPTGTDKNAVALAMSRQVDANGEAIYQGSAMYDGKQYSWYYTQSTGLGFVVNVVTQYICPAGSEGSPSYNCSVIPNSRNNPNECCPCGYAYDAGQRMCVVNLTKITACAAQCPAVAAGEIPFHLDPGGQTCSRPDQCLPPNAIDPSTGKCGPKCPVDPLPDLPEDDACAQSLEKGRGVDIDGKCPQPSDGLTGPNGQLQCFANKVAATSATARPQIPYSGPSAIVRNSAYQKHLQDVWDKMIELNKPKNKSNKACQALRDKVVAEKGCESSDSCGGVFSAGSHAIDYRPADYSNHSTGTAFDVSRKTIIGLLAELTPLPPAPTTSQQRLQFQRFVISAWLAAPSACHLVWGGSFQDPDYVHFQLP